MDLVTADSGLIGWMILMFLFAFGIVLIIGIFFLLTLQNTLKQCAPNNQFMPPGQVWLSLIPLFSYYWNFKVITAVADSLAAEFHTRGMQRENQRPGYQVGMAYCVLGVCSLLQYSGIPVIGQLCGLAGLICWITYWVKIAGYKRLLEQHSFQLGQGNPNVNHFPNQPNQ